MAHSAVYKSVSEFLQQVASREGREQGSDERSFEVLQGWIFQALHFALSDNGTYLPLLFMTQQDRPATWYEATQPNANPNHAYFHQRPYGFAEGHNTDGSCGRHFKTEGILYKCTDCHHSYCDFCFKKADHKDHLIDAEVIETEESCTCSNKEDWNFKHHCGDKKRVSTKTEVDELKREIYDINVMQDVYGACLDFCMSVSMHSNQQLPVVQERLKKLFDAGLDEFALEQIKNEIDTFQRAITTLLPRPTPPVSAYCTVLYSSFTHTEAEMKKSLESLGVAMPDIGLFTAALKFEGRVMVHSHSSLEEAMVDLKNSFKGPIPCCIMPSSGFEAGEIVKNVLCWFTQSFPQVNLGFNKSARRAFGNAITSFPRDLTVEPYWNLKNKSFETPVSSGLLNGFNSATGIPLTRLQLCLSLEFCNWFYIRTFWQNLFNDIIFSHMDFKAVCASQSFAIYDQLLFSYNAIGYSDYDEGYVNIFHKNFGYFSEAVTAVCESSTIGTIMKASYSMFEKYQFYEQGRTTIRAPEVKSVERQKLTKSIEYIRLVFKNTKSLKGLFILDNFKYFARFVEAFCYSWLVRSPTKDLRMAAAMEIVKIYDLFMDIVSNVSTMNGLIKDVSIEDFKTCFNAMLQIANQTTNVSYKTVKGHKLIEYSMSQEERGLFFQSHCIISRFLQTLHEERQPFSTAILNHDHVFNIADRALRTIVLNVLTHVAPGADRLQLYNCKLNYTECEQQIIFAYDEDIFYANIHIIQVTFLLSQTPTRMIYNILERFELLDWFLGKSSLEENVHSLVIDEMLSRVVRLFYLVLTEREKFQPFTTRKQVEYQKLKRKYTKILSLKKNATLSDINPVQNLVNDIEQTTNMVTDIVAELGGVSHRSNMLSSKYNISPEAFREIDPMSLPYFDEDFKYYEERLIRELTPKNAKGTDKVLIEPKIVKIKKYGIKLGEFARSTAFAKLLAKLISISVEKKHEHSHLSLLLHMMHAIVKDIELSLDESYFPSSFIKVPLVQCLFSLVVYCKFSKNIIDKADYLLEWMIFRNKDEVMEALKGSFGEDAVLKYRIKKMRAGLDFDAVRS
ncbi:hypothetical protein WICPIJ_006096 [Wickerhamomyces pijperi]|uniref:E3 ubiquitin-protein ligase n=1 Tax=Wickerhamomyces pijperi TaxID=599730 RepID=A0A9P8Q2V8_WICPI|nr:hypothetical protein WICPIJ_006096 [Wickerhamomyces pijperi]